MLLHPQVNHTDPPYISLHGLQTRYKFSTKVRDLCHKVLLGVSKDPLTHLLHYVQNDVDCLVDLHNIWVGDHEPMQIGEAVQEVQVVLHGHLGLGFFVERNLDINISILLGCGELCAEKAFG